MLVALSALTACGDEGSGGIQGGAVPRMEVTEGSRPVTLNGTVTVSSMSQTSIRISNSGNGPLSISAIEIEATPPEAFAILSLPTPTAEAPVVVQADGLAHDFAISYDSSLVPEGVRAQATIRIQSNKTIDGYSTFTFYAAPEAAVAKLLVQPQVLDFATVQDSQSSTKPVSLLNTGSASLTISKIYFSGHPGYSFSLGGTTYSVTAESASNGIVPPAPFTLAAGAAQQIDVTYTAQGAEAAQGSLIFVSNDPGTPNGTEVKLFANLEGPCVKVNPSRVDFGGKIVGQQAEVEVEVQSCGDVDLVVSDIALIDDGNGVFSMDKSRVGTFPLTIPAGDSVMLPVTYFPAAVAQLGGDGEFVRDSGKIQIRSNAYLANLDVELSGFGTDGRCPTAVINVAQGEEVLPQTRLQLDASVSTASSGQITGWEWSVVQPSGSVSTFIPSAYVEKPTFEANIVGTYTFRLKVFDQLGTESCSQAEYVVNVTSDDAIHVELLWRTPGDINEADTGGGMDFSAGSDLDLHFLHPSALGQYFDFSYDCYWENPLPEWGIFSPSDNPRLDRDDTDGAGPENLNVAVGEQGVRYQVGVHYWNDWGYGAAMTTVRVYIYGVLRDQWADVQLVNADMWDTHYIDWPSGVVTRITRPGGAPRVTSQYPVPGLGGGLPF
jgi:hypothetical protein